MTTLTWSIAELSQARYDISAIGGGNKIFFAGGEIGDGTSPVSTVDVYDVSANQWSTSSLSTAGSGMAPAVVGNKVLFGGGYEGSGGSWIRTTAVDIYDLTTNSWSSAFLSTARRGAHAAVTAGSKVYFSGGETWPANPVPGSWFASRTVDIYDDATNSWSTGLLSEGKYGHAGIAVKDRIFWAGGNTGAFPNIAGSCSVEIVNVITGEISIQKLFKPGYRTAHVKNNQIVFFTGDNKFDIYDVTTDKWAIGVLPTGFTGGPVISVNNTIYVVSGVQVYKLEF
jgi:N-acetylneuraminic acid mutarotase